MDEEDTLIADQIELAWDKVTTLIRYRIWGNVSIERFKGWQKQFTTDKEKFLAAYLAHQLVYYNTKDFTSLIKFTVAQGIKYVAMKNLRIEASELTDEMWIDNFDSTRMQTLVCPLSIDSPASSGFMVSRLLRNQGIIGESELCLSYQDLIEKLKKREVKAVLFVDDMIGSGQQATDALSKAQTLDGKDRILGDYIKEICPEITICIVVAIAPEKSIKIIQEKCGYPIFVGEQLREQHDVLNTEFWTDSTMHADGTRFLIKLQRERNIPLKNYGDNAWAVTFEHGAPDVASPFYYESPHGWTSLIRRRGEDE